MSYGREKVEEPDIKIFEALNELDGLKGLSPEHRYELAMCFTEIQKADVAWPMLKTLSLSQNELRRLRKMQQKAYREMRRWCAVRDLAATLVALGADIEHGKLRLSGSAQFGTFKVATR